MVRHKQNTQGRSELQGDATGAQQGCCMATLPQLLASRRCVVVATDTHVLVLRKLLPNLGLPARVLRSCSTRHSALGGCRRRSRRDCPCGCRSLRHGTCSKHSSASRPSLAVLLCRGCGWLRNDRGGPLTNTPCQTTPPVVQPSRFLKPLPRQRCSAKPLRRHTKSSFGAGAARGS